MADTRRKKLSLVADIINGNILTREKVLVHLPFVLFISLLALIYIANGFLAEDNVRRLNAVGNEVKELRSEYITIKSDLMYKSKQSELARIIDGRGLGLRESYQPPYKIYRAP
ncbi:MAG: hypothetical protein KDC37_02850 [Flavobacteriales bacterium]|jgi:hypothetical protein|nr:hypothetical protein [Flavobacteriales bacterium]